MSIGLTCHSITITIRHFRFCIVGGLWVIRVLVGDERGLILIAARRKFAAGPQDRSTWLRDGKHDADVLCIMMCSGEGQPPATGG